MWSICASGVSKNCTSPYLTQVDKLQQSDAERIEEQQEQQPPPMMMGECCLSVHLYIHILVVTQNIRI